MDATPATARTHLWGHMLGAEANALPEEGFQLSSWRQVWLEVMGPAARALHEQGFPLTYVQALYPLPAGKAPTGVRMQARLVQLIADRLRQGESLFLFPTLFDAAFKAEGASYERRMVTPWQTNREFLTKNHILNTLTGRQPESLDAPQQIGELGTISYVLSYWLLCEDETLLAGEAGQTVADMADRYLNFLTLAGTRPPRPALIW